MSQVDFLPELVGVCDGQEDTFLDSIATATQNYLPLYLSNLKHFGGVLGLSVLRWFDDTKNVLPQTGAYSGEGLLRYLQKYYQDENESVLTRTHLKTEQCLDCQLKRVCHNNCVKGIPVECQTSEDLIVETGIETKEEEIIAEIVHHLKALKPGSTPQPPPTTTQPPPTTTQPPPTNTQPPPTNTQPLAEPHDSYDGPEVPPEEPGEVAGVSQVPAQGAAMATNDNRQNSPRTNLPQSDSDSDSSSDAFDAAPYAPGTSRDAVGAGGQQGQQEGMCKRCFENEMDVVLLPCGHFVICSSCASVVSRCMTCNEVIQASLRAYRA